MRISDWSSDVGSSDLRQEGGEEASCEEGCQEGHQEDGEEGPREACQEGGQEEACQEGREEGQAPGEASCEKGRPRGDPRRTCADDVKTRNRSAVIRLPLRMPRRRGSFFWFFTTQIRGRAFLPDRTHRRDLPAAPECGSQACLKAPLSALSRRLRSEEHTSELQSLMRISSAVFCLKKKKIHIQAHLHQRHTT